MKTPRMKRIRLFVAACLPLIAGMSAFSETPAADSGQSPPVPTLEQRSSILALDSLVLVLGQPEATSG
jgi:hypothetical protein